MVCLAAMVQVGALAAADGGRGYVVVAAAEDMGKAEWREVAEVLLKKHKGKLVTYGESVGEVKGALAEMMPGRVCFVVPHARAGREFVKAVHLLSRGLDADPYADFLWGIVTGYDAANALEIAKTAEPLTVRKVASGTEVGLEKCEEGVWYCELRQGHVVEKAKGGVAEVGKGPADTTAVLVGTLNDYKADLFVTSGHATERDWQIGFRYKNGVFRCEGGRLYGSDTAGKRYAVDSPNPKVYLPIGNCLMGHIDGADAMALAFMHSAGVRQMVGYTVPTWYGYGGWGCLDYFVEQPGRHSFVEAFFANQHALVHRLATCFPGLEGAEVDFEGRTAAAVEVSEEGEALGLGKRDGVGLLFDRDVVAFYGDPGWEARMAAGECNYGQTLEREGDVFTLTVTPEAGAGSFAPVNENGSQRGWRPVVQYLPGRFEVVRVTEGEGLGAVVADDFVLVPNPGAGWDGKGFRLVFEVRELGAR